jgi:SAM-dependent methyltransferase
MGVDLSREGIAEARERAGQTGVSVAWRHSDMRDLPWESEFDGAFCFGNSFGYLEPEGTRAFVRAVARALRPGARFALDSGMAAESVLPNLREREWSRIDDILFLEENRYRAAESCVETMYTFVRGGETHTRTGLHWVYTLREIRGLLAEAGLVTRDLCRSLEGEPFEVGSPYLLLVAEKRVDGPVP